MNRMDEVSIKKLILTAPLVYRRDATLRFPPGDAVRGEVLFRMALDPAQSRGIEPDRTAFPGSLEAAGYALRREEAESRDSETPELLELPAGTYFFAQIWEPPDMETLIDMIIDVQQEGLWERFSLGGQLYIRRLFEDGRLITQIFRPAEPPKDAEGRLFSLLEP